ncbi:MAG: KEOPS complex kinase/ATPase Bud32 [Candidatus Diapherotrites archaeon]|nr:KEOPS complex kinase/ATPase Bud32 [Candidatus Diapherotrites archaeon]
MDKIGAEAVISKKVIDSLPVISKKRVPKAYRNPLLDLKIRKERTRSEVKLLHAASSVVNTPKIISVDEKNAEILMEFIPGNPLKLVLDKNSKLCIEAGKCIRKLHDIGIIHGDLTTSNIIFAEDPKEMNEDLKNRIKQKGPLFFIDFGLGYFSIRLEDKATDLVVFKKTFNATHSKIKNGWELVIQGYNPEKEFIARIEAIEKRTRYH